MMAKKRKTVKHRTEIDDSFAGSVGNALVGEGCDAQNDQYDGNYDS